ncbi:MAG: sensor histidine kinase N-terminal domain-containing protein [Betaproteobacteria bacterium]|nr:sensor histidine kinase N-terminal domain-containing protein [Betaproteobacteria bacterium]MDE2623369.1 sensor histidine kinase N-terminal domain-containing protein [Betaproteobacteria bacterium]
MNSLRLRLVLLLSLAAGITLSAAVYFTHRAARQELDALFDAQLSETANVLLGTARREMVEKIEHGTDAMPVATEYEQTLVYQIWDSNGLIVRSAAAPPSPLGPSAAGFIQARVGGKPWRVLTRWDPAHEFMIQIAEPMAGREHVARLIALKMLAPSVTIIPLLTLLIWLSVGTGLRPLRQLRREVVQRSARRLEPLALQSVPIEVTPLVAALNDLFGRLRQSIESEKRFTADAAHELRTPLAALKTQAQVAQRAQSPEDRGIALQHVIEGVDRATHLIEQLLTLARVDPETASHLHQPVPLRALAVQALSRAASFAHQRQIELALDEGEEMLVNGHEGHLDILLRNLLDNAIRYTPAGGQVQTRIIRSEKKTVLTVCDNGPGIPVAERRRALERFYRLPGSTAEGSGLGLSIVQRIAERHGAEVSLLPGPDGRGLCVRIVFPPLAT